ncbi:hypothetical protein NC653_024157 [Populus alba x Populus x berolinensis]|uniref:HSA domain-containing protein n=1 Tax=Populus alba x Populus x berolinensis TaxID=444605 RepID=A0AAD6M836_9ROSI|nr:hypothetical protein NC653_024157 [Populus alba x Populus x berolinensis]
MMEDKSGLPSDPSMLADERKYLYSTRKLDAEIQRQEAMESQAVFTTAMQQPDSARGGLPLSNPVDSMGNAFLQVGKTDHVSSATFINKQAIPEAVSWTRIGSQSLPSGSIQLGLVPDRKDNAPSQFHNLGNSNASDDSKFEFQTRYALDACKVVSVDVSLRNDVSFTTEQDDDDKSAASTDSPPSPKYTMLEKWIMDQQRKKLLTKQGWVLKQQKTKQRIATCFDKLKETVSSSEDISAKTKIVIELKKLQLLELQRRLRSNFLNDFFKPITNDMDRLKSYKKHKHGRRIKQLERYEQKMKEERQKRIRERQKEFFAEIEVHKERLEDVFKIKRERWKGVNKYVKEFHKRKERTHREKIDRIQREKINLLKINDVEGYLRMVQDAKSDRVKQLLKETEKYLQKLGSKLQEAKSMASRFENDMDESRHAAVVEKNETSHYMESNEKYYLMAHSILLWNFYETTRNLANLGGLRARLSLKQAISDCQNDDEECRRWRFRLSSSMAAFTWGSLLRITFFLLLIAAVVFGFFTLPVEKILKDFLLWVEQDLGPWGPLVLAVAYIPLTVLAVPAAVLTLGGGYLFGLPLGFVADSIGATIGAGAAFLLGRTNTINDLRKKGNNIGRSFVVSKLKDYPKFRSVAIAIQKSGFKIVLLLRLVPLLPFNMLNYLLSVTPVPIGEYMLASWIGMMVFIILGLLVSVVLIFCVTKVAKSALDKALAENEDLDFILASSQLTIVADIPVNLNQPLIIKIDPSEDKHEK